jgi:hypothetical protein
MSDMSPFEHDTSTVKGHNDANRLFKFLLRNCGECGHPASMHDDNGFCVVCRNLNEEAIYDFNSECL